MKKKYVIALVLISTFVIGALRMNYINASSMPVSISKEQVIQESTVTEAEKEELQAKGISYDEIVQKNTDLSEWIFNNELVYRKDSKYIFLSDGAMESGPVNDESSYVVDGRTGIVLARYNPGKDPNGVDWETAKELNTLRNIRVDVDYQLKNN